MAGMGATSNHPSLSKNSRTDFSNVALILVSAIILGDLPTSRCRFLSCFRSSMRKSEALFMSCGLISPSMATVHNNRVLLTTEAGCKDCWVDKYQPCAYSNREVLYFRRVGLGNHLSIREVY